MLTLTLCIDRVTVILYIAPTHFGHVVHMVYMYTFVFEIEKKTKDLYSRVNKDFYRGSQHETRISRVVKTALDIVFILCKCDT